jgi:hypothetical protein
MQTFETAIIERYRRREGSVEEALIEMYLAGVSVRRVEDITEALWGTRVSPKLSRTSTRKSMGPSRRGAIFLMHAEIRHCIPKQVIEKLHAHFVCITSPFVSISSSRFFLRQGDQCDRRALRPHPDHIRSDNEPEFVVEAAREWIRPVGTKTALLQAAGLDESFKGADNIEKVQSAFLSTVSAA